MIFFISSPELTISTYQSPVTWYFDVFRFIVVEMEKYKLCELKCSK